MLQCFTLVVCGEDLVSSIYVVAVANVPLLTLHTALHRIRTYMYVHVCSAVNVAGVHFAVKNVTVLLSTCVWLHWYFDIK